MSAWWVIMQVQALNNVLNGWVQGRLGSDDGLACRTLFVKLGHYG